MTLRVDLLLAHMFFSHQTGSRGVPHRVRNCQYEGDSPP